MHYHNTTNARTFNLAFNEFAGTNGVVYAREFPMDVHSGAQYLEQNRANIGRQYATQVLEGKVGPSCCLKGSSQHNDMTLQQRAVLSYMRETTTDSEFDSALHAAMDFGALPDSARHVFAVGYAIPPMFCHSSNTNMDISSDPATRSSLSLASPTSPTSPTSPILELASSSPVPHNAAMADEEAPTPSRVTLSASSNIGRSVPLQQKAKRARKVK